MNKRIQTSLILLAAITLLVLLLDFLSRRQPEKLDESQRQAVLVYADPIADRLTAAIIAGDYESAAQGFGDALQKQFTRSDFDAIVQQWASYGELDSRQVQEILFEKGKMVVYYRLVFTNTRLDMRLVIDPSRPHRLLGLAFRTPSAVTPTP